MTPRALPLLALPLLLAAAGCDRGHDDHAAGAPPALSPPREIADTTLARLRTMPLPAELAAGEAAYEANCASCHGVRATGTAFGPPLVHIVYEPGHHADIAFHYAAERGVRAHHWGFGDMPAVPAVTRDDVTAIIAYVRFLQREAGIR